MRKPRVVVIDDEVFILNMLKTFFQMRGYEVVSFNDAAAVCPLFGLEGEACRYSRPCTDILITDFSMPGMNGVELIGHQQRSGCKVHTKNKAVISGYIDAESRSGIQRLGCAFFQKPFTFTALGAWLDECERRMDLTVPLATRRKEEREESSRDLFLRIPRLDHRITARTVNESRSGLCLEMPEPLHMDELVLLDNGSAGSCRQASVRWVQKTDRASYLTGLLCC